MIRKFWKNYKNKTSLEERAIKSIERSLDFLFSNLPKKDIVSIYIKGSFVTREMNDRSDVDIVPILRDNNVLNRFRKIRNQYNEQLKPSEFVPISLTELKQNKNEKSRNPLRNRPDTFLRDLDYYVWIYGMRIKKSSYPMRGANEIYKDDIKRFRENLRLLR